MKYIIALFCGLTILAGSVLYSQTITKKRQPVKILTDDGSEILSQRKGAGANAAFNNPLRIPPPGDSIGFTYYDYPTNGCSKKNIFTFETGEIYVIRMARSNDWTTGPNNRGSYAAFFDGSDWSAMMGPIEGAVKGFTDAGVFDDGSGWSVAHTGNVHSVDLAKGAMNWTPKNHDGNTAIWPVAASVGNDTILYVSTPNGGTGPTSGMVFMRSFDGGDTWSNPYRLDSAVVNPYGKELRISEGYSISAFHNHIAAVQMSYTSATDSLSGMGIVNLYESSDYGTSWTRREINPPATPEPVPFGTNEERAFIDPYALHDPQGRLHVLWSTSSRIHDETGNGYFFTDNNKILHWSEATGVRVAAFLPAGTAGVNISNNDMNMGYHGMPSCAFDGYGNLFLIYHRVSEPSDTDAAGNIYYQIYGVASPNNGATWYAPVNITNTVGFDNQGANVAPYFGSDYYLYIVYNSDPFTGNQVQGSQTVEWPVAVKVLRLWVVGIEPDANEKKEFYRSLHLKQNYPNPFNPSTVIEYEVKTATPITLKIFNILGQEVKTLIQSRCNPGSYRVIWDGRDNSGNAVSSGVYHYRLEAGGQRLTRKMILLK